MNQIARTFVSDLSARVGAATASIAFLAVFAASAAAQDDAFKKDVAPFLTRHCVECHGPKKQESRLRLDQVTGVQHGNRHLWTMVHERVSAGEMPPKDHPQPTEAERKQLLKWVVEQQRSLGVAGTRRLNRRELSAALTDVTGLNVDFSAALPGDGTIAGFDTGAEALQEASDAVSQWLLLTRRAVDGLRFLDPPKDTKKYSLDCRQVNAKDPRKMFDAWKELGVNVRSTAGSLSRPGLGILLEPKAVGERDAFGLGFPTAADRQGILRLTLTVSALPNAFEGVPKPRLWVEVGGKSIDFREVSATPDNPEKIVYEIQLGDLVVQSKGVSLNLINRVEIPYAVKGFENEDRVNPKDPIPGGSGLFRPAYDKKALPPEKAPAPFLVVHAIEADPDLTVVWPPAEWKADVGKIQDDLPSANRLLGLWMERAWRRPVSVAERAPFLKLYQKQRVAGASFDDSLRAAFQSVLIAAPFRYQSSPGHPDPVVAQHALASRLSFMLVGAPPDGELRKLAAEGKMRDPKVLDAQVDRLIADPRSMAFFRPFAMQWLVLDQPITIAQSHINKQDFRFARYYKASMREETIAYIAELFAENRPAGELVSSDWTMMNDALAIHYGYPGIHGGELRKVKLRPDDPRGGGILGHAGIQSMLCWMGENWVIYRGAWALRHILDFPPPPPPLEVPELNPSDAKNKGKPFRELLKQHQEDSRCAVCHKYMDPVGFAFQNFDISGRWRNVEHESYARAELDGRISWRGVGETRPVDSVGNLPRGETFKTFAEFKQIVVKNYQNDLVRGVLKNMVVYGAGRVPSIDDMAEINDIMRTLRTKGFPLRELVKAVVRSEAFLETNQPIVDRPAEKGPAPAP